MRIVCPSCEATYDVEDRLLRPGRATRCGRCEYRWVPLAAVPSAAEREPDHPAAPAPGAAFPLPSGPTALDRLSAESARPEGTLALRLAWATSVVVLIALIAGLYAGRAAVAEFWPPSLRLYLAFGVAPATESPHRGPEARQEGADHGGEARQHPADRGH